MTLNFANFSLLNNKVCPNRESTFIVKSAGDDSLTKKGGEMFYFCYENRTKIDDYKFKAANLPLELPIFRGFSFSHSVI